MEGSYQRVNYNLEDEVDPFISGFFCSQPQVATTNLGWQATKSMAREFGAILCPAEENLVTLFYSTTYGV